MLISRLALSLFWFPGVYPLRLEYFHIPQKDYGFLFLFSLFNFQGPVRSLFSVKRLTILSHFVVFVKNFFQKFFGSFSEKSFSILSHLSMFVKNFFALTFRGTFLSYHNHSRFVKIFSAPLSAWLFYHAFSLLSTPFFAFSPYFSRFVKSALFSCGSIFSHK